jgi:hypothetical protein
VVSAIKIHHCAFSEEERAMLRDVITGGKMAKKIILTSIIVGILALLGMNIHIPNFFKN